MEKRGRCGGERGWGHLRLPHCFSFSALFRYPICFVIYECMREQFVPAQTNSKQKQNKK
jgi:hypothetical protein